MYNSKLDDDKGVETDLAYNTRLAYCMFKAEHVGEKITRQQFINWCEQQIKKGPFILEKKPNKSSVKKWYKRWSHEESAISYILNEIKNRLSTADDKYNISVLELIIEDLKFIKRLYDEKNNLKKSDFLNLKDYFLTLKHIDEEISIIERRVRVRLGLANSYTDNLNKHEGSMIIQQQGLENIHELTDDDLDLILSANDDYEDFTDKL